MGGNSPAIIDRMSVSSWIGMIMSTFSSIAICTSRRRQATGSELGRGTG